MNVRPAQPGEAGRLASIHIETWQHAYRTVFPSEYLQGLDLGRRELWFEARILERERLLVADSEAGPVGFCFFGNSADDGWGEVFAIYVHPDHWGQGHGARLLSAAESGLVEMSHERALLWVLEENLRARSFYERQGWAIGKPMRLEEIGGRQVTEVRYERALRAGPRPSRDHRDM